VVVSELTIYCVYYSENEIAVAILRIVEVLKTVVEGAAATGLAACLFGKLDRLKGKKLVHCVCVCVCVCARSCVHPSIHLWIHVLSCKCSLVYSVAVVLTGSNIDTPVLNRCLERGLVNDGRLVMFQVLITDRPGGLSELLKLLVLHNARY